MPLELCPDCENHCSTSAKVCPKCGYIFKRDSEFITQLSSKFITQLRSKQKTLLEDSYLLSWFGISILYLLTVPSLLVINGIDLSFIILVITSGINFSGYCHGP